MNKVYFFFLVSVLGTYSCCTDRKENQSSSSQTEEISSVQLASIAENTHTKIPLEFQSFLDRFPPFDYPFICESFDNNGIHEELPKKFIKTYFTGHYAALEKATKIYPIAKRQEGMYWLFLAHIIHADETMPVDGILALSTSLDGRFIQIRTFAEKTDEAHNLGHLLSHRRQLYYTHNYYYMKDTQLPERFLIVFSLDSTGNVHQLNSAEYSPNYPPLDSIYQNQ